MKYTHTGWNNTAETNHDDGQPAAGYRGQEAGRCGWGWHPGPRSSQGRLRLRENTPPPRSVACGAAPITRPRQALQPRLGLSLTEVLIATFVMAIGILSLASLIPVGLHEVAVANRAQHGAVIGRSAWREIKTREWMRPLTSDTYLWFDRQGNPAVPFGTLVPPNLLPPTPGYPSPPTYISGAFAIDPLFMSVNSNETQAAVFPYPTDSLTAPRLPRLTLKLSEFDALPIVKTSLPNPPLYPLAEQIFVSRNDPTFSPINLATGAKTDRPHRVFDSNNLPQIGGEYSWMMTVSPSSGDSGRLYTVSVVVFYKRALQLPALSGTPAEQQKRECTANLEFQSAGIGGGDIELTWTASADGLNAPKVKPNQWLMIYRLLNPAGPATGPRICGWYRVLATDDYNPGLTPGVRHMTVQGPDWDTSNGTQLTAFAALFDSVVGVYTKTIQLE